MVVVTYLYWRVVWGIISVGWLERLLLYDLADFNAVGFVFGGEAFICSDESSCVFIIAVDEFYAVVLPSFAFFVE